jgi:hypothetical protein
MNSEDEDNIRLRKASEFIAHCRESENQARRELNAATERTKYAREKHATLFAECEARAVARRKAGLIAVNPGY